MYYEAYRDEFNDIAYHTGSFPSQTNSADMKKLEAWDPGNISSRWNLYILLVEITVNLLFFSVKKIKTWNQCNGIIKITRRTTTSERNKFLQVVASFR